MPSNSALRQWAFDPLTEDPLVTTYVATQAAVPAGAWGSNDTDSQIVGRPVPDLYRFWQHGRDGFADPSLGLISYFQGSDFSWENAVNLYNPSDSVLALWDDNNAGKELLLKPPIWPYSYEFTPGDGENVNNDIFTRVPDVGSPVNLTLALPNGRPGRDAYEILAFYSQSATLALGAKNVRRFDTNVNIENFGMLGGSDIGANHSYQFYHDAAETWDYYELLKTEMGFDATHGAGAILANERDGQSRKPSSRHIEMSAASVGTELVASDSSVLPSWLPFSNKPVAFSTSIGLRNHGTATASIANGTADLRPLDLFLRQSPGEDLDSAIGSNKQPPQEHASRDRFFETLDDWISSVFA